MVSGGAMQPRAERERAQEFVLTTVFEELVTLQQEIARVVDVQADVTVYPLLGLGGVEFLVRPQHAPASERQAVFIFLAFAYVDDSEARCGFELWPATVAGRWPSIHSGQIALYDDVRSTDDRRAIRVQQFVRNRFVAALRAWGRRSA